MTNYPDVQLPSPIIVQQQITASSYKITDVTDNPVQKTVVARAVIGENGINFYTIWSGESYDLVGQWTDEQLETEVTKIVMSNYPTVSSII